MIIKLLITYQILLINLSLTHILAKRKYSNWITFGVLFLFTLGLSLIFYVTTTIFSEAKPTPWFVLAGMLYIAPLALLYRIKLKELITIMIYCWTYTMILSAVATGISNFIDVLTQNIVILISQTLLFTISFYTVIKFTKNKFMVVIDNASNRTIDALILLGVSLFATITSIRYFINPEGNMYYILLFLLIIIIITSYKLLFLYIESNINLESAKKIVYHDSLTGIENRYSLFIDIQKYISDQQHFTLFFLDLDQLKQINDTYGHNTGDQYLKHFALTMSNQVNNDGTSYRFAGDEFVCIFPKKVNEIDIKKFKENISKEMNKLFKFGGVSIGTSEYPKDGLDGDTLLRIADNRMYGEKNSKKIRSNDDSL